MSLQDKLATRAGKPIGVGLIGAGKFGSMFLSQVPAIAGIEVVVIADLDPERARQACRTVGWEATCIARTRFTDQARDACQDAAVEVVIEATGNLLPALPMRSPPSRPVSTSSWSMSRPMCSPA